MNNLIKVNGKIKLLPLVGLTLMPLLGGGLIGFLIKNSVSIYDKLDKPFFSPPWYVFVGVWSILYLLMGFASYRIYMLRDAGVNVGNALFLYLVQLMLNYLWPIIFFSFRLYGLAFIELIILLVLVGYTFYKFIKLDKISGIFLIPYMAWLIFAGILNYFIWYKNEMFI